MKLNIFQIILFLLLLSSCKIDDNPAFRRSDRAKEAQGEIIIGAISNWSALQKEFAWEGVELAISEINSKGGVDGRKFVVLKEDDLGSVEVGRKIADKLAQNPDVVAAFGHNSSSITIATSVVYNYYGILMICPASEDPLITQRKGISVFRTTPSSKTFAKKIADFSREQQYKKVAIYSERDVYGRNFANFYENRATELGIEIVYRQIFDVNSNEKYFYNDLLHLKEHYQFDALLIAGGKGQAGKIIKTINRLSLNVPVMGTESMDSPLFLEAGGAASKRILIPSSYHHEMARKEARDFATKFYKKYKKYPDGEAARWYESIKLYAQAVKLAKSSDPMLVKEELRNIRNFAGVTGVIAFDSNGDLTKENIIIKTVEKGKFEIVSQ